MKALQETNFCSVFHKDKYCFLYWTSGQKRTKMETDFLEKYSCFQHKKIQEGK